MDREGFRNRLKQYKKAREENPGLKYWEWKAIPKYDGGTSMVGTPSVGIADFTNNLVNLLSEASIKGLKNTIKRRLYDNLDPYNYSNWDLGESAQTRIMNSVWKNKRDLLMLYREDEYSNERDDIFAEYLEIPKENRHKIYNLSGVYTNHLVIPSKYKPSKAKNNNVEYKTIDKISHKDIVKSLDYADNLNFNENATVKGNLSKYFGYYTVGRGLDPKRGEYISVYDLWDINPFYGKFGSDSEYGNWLDKLIHKKVGNEDASLGIGKPIEFYDRVYLNDYYGVDSAPNKGDYYGGYLPEITVTPTKYAEGGQVEPDPLEVLERSRPKVAGIPINDKPLSGTDPLGELYLNLVSGNAVRKAVVNGVNGIVRKSFYDNYKELLKAGWNRQRAYNYASPELGIAVLPGITKGFDYAIRGANYTHAVEDFVK